MASFEELLVWQKAHALVLQIYPLCSGLPSHEKYALADQLRRAATSVPTNIAEGYGTGMDGLFLRHIAIAQGSLAETRYLLLLCRDLSYVGIDDYEAVSALSGEVSRLLSKFRQAIQTRLNNRS
ncbi:MAG: four helix bundle protein [Armatimonadia bacterium]